jgi:hypothetical protein
MDALARGFYSSLLVAALAAILLVLGGCNDVGTPYKPYHKQEPVPSRVDSLGYVEGCRMYRIKETDSNRWKYLVLCPNHGQYGMHPTITMEGSTP